MKSLINHESAAKAILKGAVRNLSHETKDEMSYFLNDLALILGIKAKSARNKRLVELFDKSFSQGLLSVLKYDFIKIRKQTRMIWLHLALGQYSERELKTVHRYPVSIYTLDLWRSRDVRGYELLFYFSKHSLERVLLREQEVSVKMVSSHLGLFASSLSRAIIKGVPEVKSEGFVMISANGLLMAIQHKNESQTGTIPLITTYIPYKELNKKKRHLLKHILEDSATEPQKVYFIESITLQNALSNSTEQLTVDSCFECNRGLCGTEDYPVIIDSQTILSMAP